MPASVNLARVFAVQEFEVSSAKHSIPHTESLPFPGPIVPTIDLCRFNIPETFAAHSPSPLFQQPGPKSPWTTLILPFPTGAKATQNLKIIDPQDLTSSTHQRGGLIFKPVPSNQDEIRVSQYSCSYNDQHQNLLDIHTGEPQGIASAVYTYV